MQQQILVCKFLLIACIFTKWLGRALNDVEARQRRRKLASLRASCKNALQFAESFGINLLSISFESVTEEPITFDYSSHPEQVPTLPTSSHGTCTPSEVLYLLDRFGVSDEFYHERSMIIPSLPRSYLVKEERRVLVSQTDIRRLPIPYYGCYLPIKEYLTRVISTYDVCSTYIIIQ